MQTIDATTLKNRLGEVLAHAALSPIAIQRHGRVVAWLIPPPTQKNRKPIATPTKSSHWNRRSEERVIELCASGDFRPSRWLRAGDPQTLAGIATMLASEKGFDRARMLTLAERLHPGMSQPAVFGRWLARSPVHAARFLPMLAVRRRDAHESPP